MAFATTLLLKTEPGKQNPTRERLLVSPCKGTTPTISATEAEVEAEEDTSSAGRLFSRSAADRSKVSTENDEPCEMRRTSLPFDDFGDRNTWDRRGRIFRKRENGSHGIFSLYATGEADKFVAKYHFDHVWL